MTDPWFYYYKGRGFRHLRPANATGCRILIATVAVMFAAALLLAVLSPHYPQLIWVWLGLVAVIMALFLWAAATHSEAIDIDQLVREYRERKGGASGRR